MHGIYQGSGRFESYNGVNLNCSSGLNSEENCKFCILANSCNTNKVQDEAGTQYAVISDPTTL